MGLGQEIALIKALGGGSSLPSVSSSDNGKVLAVEDGAWAAQAKKFIVTLTPTALDYSGTMDKTVAEINAAYEAGMEIWFAVQANGLTLSAPCSQVTYASSRIYPSFDCDIVDITNRVMIHVYTAYEDDGTKQTYSTSVYSLTPAS